MKILFKKFLIAIENIILDYDLLEHKSQGNIVKQIAKPNLGEDFVNAKR